MADSKPRFYVYEVRDGEGCVYIGKGSGRRLNAQSRRFGCEAKIIDWFQTEEAAYAAERRYIAERKPRVNRHPGGNGSRVKVNRKSRRKDFWTRNLELIGSRRYAARLLLGAERSVPGIVDPSKLDAIRQVANGPRC